MNTLNPEVRRPRALLMDYYGTIVEENDWLILDVCRRVSETSAIGATVEEIGVFWRVAFDALCRDAYLDRYVLQKEIERISLEQVLDRFRSPLDAAAISPELAASCADARLLPESREVLARVDLPICLVTNIDNAEQRAAMANTGLHFEHVVSSEDCRAYKPRPEMFWRALELMGIRPQDALFVGDSLNHDVVGARALGISTLWLNRSKRQVPTGVSAPTHVADDLRGLLSLL